jgi:rSAM/selenodomain-associated transferase 2
MPLAVIVPVLDEAAGIEGFLRALAPLRAEGIEVIVADGGSLDGTPELARPWADQVLQGPRGRARQMNAGAAAARADSLLFLHADTTLPAGALTAVRAALGDGGPGRGAAWGRFDVAIDGRSRLLPLVAALMNRRSRWTGIATGDQALFMRRSAFEAVGGFPDQPLMEDVEISRRLKRLGRPACLALRVRTSGRRWDQRGAWRTVWLMWRLRALYWLGASPERLARMYR